MVRSYTYKARHSDQAVENRYIHVCISTCILVVCLSTYILVVCISICILVVCIYVYLYSGSVYNYTYTCILVVCIYIYVYLQPCSCHLGLSDQEHTPVEEGGRPLQAIGQGVDSEEDRGRHLPHQQSERSKDAEDKE